jgi:hypothetical protein
MTNQTPTEKQRDAVNASLAAAANRLDTLCAEIENLDQAAQTLKDQGTTPASAYWRHDRYLYLIHPTFQGTRERQYVGNDPDKIKLALASIERHKRRVDIEAQAHKLRVELDQLQETAAALTDSTKIPTLYYHYNDRQRIW